MKKNKTKIVKKPWPTKDAIEQLYEMNFLNNDNWTLIYSVRFL